MEKWQMWIGGGVDVGGCEEGGRWMQMAYPYINEVKRRTLQVGPHETRSHDTVT